MVALFLFTLLLVSLVREADCIDIRLRRGCKTPNPDGRSEVKEQSQLLVLENFWKGSMALNLAAAYLSDSKAKQLAPLRCINR